MKVRAIQSTSCHALRMLAALETMFHGHASKRDLNCFKGWRKSSLSTVSAPPQRSRASLISISIAELLLKAQELKGLEKPSTRDYRSVLHFMENDGGQVFEEESGWIYDKEDLITIRPGREHAWLDGLMERMLKAFQCRLLKVCSILPHIRRKYKDSKREADDCPRQFFFTSKV